MALRGNLKDFSLPDVFQLVTFSRKTGVLRIAREDGARGSVWFRDGDVFFASSDWHSKPLGERLVDAGRVTPQALDSALKVRASEGPTGRRLGRILIDEGHLAEDVLESFVSEQIQETIFDLMRWDEGEFDFESMPEVVDEDIGLSVAIENLVMEGSRRLEEWNRIRKKIPSMDVVFKMATAPGEGTFEISLKPAEWQLLYLVDSSRSVAELALATNRTDFEVARVVYGLFSAGLLEFATDEEVERARAERAVRDEKRKAAEKKLREAEEAARKAAQEREAALAAAAEERRLAQEAARSAESPTPTTIPRASDEVPEFLGGARVAPSASDQAVLDEVMGAILDAPTFAPPAAPPVAEVLRAPRYEPVEEPAFMSATHEEESDLPLVTGMSVEDLLPGFGAAVQPVAEQAPAVEQAPAIEPPPAIEFTPEIDDIIQSLDQEEQFDQLVVEPASVSEPLAEPPVEEPVAATGFESDLMALGLGELPPEIVPVAEMPPAQPVTEWVDESILTPTDAGIAATGVPVEPVAASMGGIADGHDFSELLSSLDVDADESVTEPAAPSGFDPSLLLDDEEEVVGGGVISTDAFLEDIGTEDFSFSMGMGDELSALTGVERRTSARPQATVTAIPEPGAHSLKRDTRVDKSTLLSIIEGVKNL